MKVIFVHGRDQQEQSPRQLRANWLTAWEKGLAKSNLILPAEKEILVPYYAKTLYEMSEEVELPKKSGEVQRSGTDGINEAEQLEFYRNYLKETALASATSRAEKMDIEAMSEIERGFLNWEVVQKLLGYLDKKNILGDYPIKKGTKDVFMYLTQRPIKEAVNNIVEAVLDKEPCVVVGHSLGSIVAYLVLKNNPQLNVKKFITIGSPLGINALAKHLEPPFVMPDCIKGNAPDRWYNAYDERDYVALKPLDRENFNNGFPIINSTHVDNHTANSHGIAGYLDDKVIAKLIYDAMME